MAKAKTPTQPQLALAETMQTHKLLRKSSNSTQKSDTFWLISGEGLAQRARAGSLKGLSALGLVEVRNVTKAEAKQGYGCRYVLTAAGKKLVRGKQPKAGAKV